MFVTVNHALVGDIECECQTKADVLKMETAYLRGMGMNDDIGICIGGRIIMTFGMGGICPDGTGC